MVIYRLVRSTYKDDFSGTGAYLYGGRWNSKGMYALYAAAHISLAVLEMVVNLDKSVLTSVSSYHLIEISLSDSLVYPFKHGELKEGWIRDREFTQFIGDGFLNSQSGLVLEIQSAVIPEESNFLINPGHPDFEKLTIGKSVPYNLDERLW